MDVTLEQVKAAPQAAFRMYGLRGCGHCDKAIEFLINHKLNTEIILDADPVIEGGIKTISERQQGSYPILVSFRTNEVIVGFKEGDYERLAKFYHSSISPSVPDGNPTAQ